MNRHDKVVGIIAARMQSSRLPGKALLDLGGRRVLDWVVGRAQRAATIDELVVATSAFDADDPIIAACHELGVRCFRGSEDDVLGRFAAAAEDCDAEWIVRINGDNPLIDPAYLDELVTKSAEAQCEYMCHVTGNGKPVMLVPLGFFGEVIGRRCLERAQGLITSAFEREHVTLGIYQRPEEFQVHFLRLPSSFDHPDLRFTLDTAEDLKLLRELLRTAGEDVFEMPAAEVVRIALQQQAWQESMHQQNQLNPKSTK